MSDNTSSMNRWKICLSCCCSRPLMTRRAMRNLRSLEAERQLKSYAACDACESFTECLEHLRCQNCTSLETGHTPGTHLPLSIVRGDLSRRSAHVTPPTQQPSHSTSSLHGRPSFHINEIKMLQLVMWHPCRQRVQTSAPSLCLLSCLGCSGQ